MRFRDAGSVSAELAVALPAVIAIAGVLLGGVRLAADHAWLAGASSSAARLISLGTPQIQALNQVIGQRPGVTADVEITSGTVCVELRSRMSNMVIVAGLEAQEKSCVPRTL